MDHGAAPPSALDAPLLPHAARDFVTLGESQTVAEAMEHIRSLRLPERIVYFYVVDGQGRLCGVVPTRRLLMSPLAASIRSLMIGEVVTLPDTATLRDASEAFLRHRFLALPLVDPAGRLVGVTDVTLFHGRAAEMVQRRTEEDIFQLIGIQLARARKASAWEGFRGRFPWLLTNIAGGLLCALLSSRYEAFLDAFLVLALFIPVVLTLSESVSIQSMTITLQALHGAPPDRRGVSTALLREGLTATLLGAGSGALVGAVAWAWKGDFPVAVAIFGSITLSMLTSCLLGVVLPLAVRALRRDPRIAAGPIVLAMADIATLLFYFNLSGMILR